MTTSTERMITRLITDYKRLTPEQRARFVAYINAIIAGDTKKNR